MKVRARFDAVLERIGSQLLLKLLPDAVRLPDVAARRGVGFLVGSDQIGEHFEIGEFVGR